jgi:subfamily B ATP-binding cassette protein MsbA
MKRFLKILRFVIPYWHNAVLNFIYNLLSVIFSLFSFTMTIPFLGVLFGVQKTVEKPVPFEFSVASITHNFNYFISNIIEKSGPESALFTIILLVVVMVFFKTGFAYLAKYVMSPLRMGVIRDIRNNIYRKILNLHVGYYSEERKGDIMSRMTADVQEIEFSIMRWLDVVFKEPVTIIVYIISLFIMSYQLTFFVLVLLPVSGIIIGRIGKSLRKKSSEVQRRLGLLLSLIDETLGGIRIIKAFNSEKKSEEKFKTENQAYTRLLIRIWRRMDLAVPMGEFLGTIVVVIMMWFGGTLVLGHKGSLESQEFIAYLIIFSQVINPAKSFSSAYYSILRGMASADRIDVVLNAEEKYIEKNNALPITEFKTEIEYRNVSFAYDKETVLSNINLKIGKGKTIALVGQSGAGKSTLVDLLPRLYDPASGEILIDGVPVTDYKISHLRNLMGVVSQESVLFNDTIFNNIAFSVENAGISNVITAAKVANAHQFITDTEYGYETNIGDRGNKLSGGQRQRLCIARAVLKNPPILILDEATSSLDTESERLVQDALTRLMKNRTSLVIAHRLSTVIHADEICVLHEGKIVERGKHEDLLALNGYYKKLHDLQAFA